jgi:cytochrome P450
MIDLERLFRRARGIARRMRLKVSAHPAALTAETIDFDAFAVARDPYPYYEQLRRRGPIHFLPRHHAWIVLGHEEVQSVFSRPQLFSNRPYGMVDAVLLGADPPEHTAVRRIVGRFFATETIERLVRFAEGRAASLLQEAELDVVTGYARPLSEAVAAELLGWSDDTVEAIRAAQTESREFVDFTRALDRLAHRAAMFARLEAEGIGEAEARSLVRLLWLASTKTVERTIAHGTRLLLQHDDVRAAIARDAALLPPFIDEVLRLNAPELNIRRATTAAVQLGGVELPAGALVFLCLAAANRDPARYEQPAALRLDRAPVRYLGFGHGVHYCVGATLGRRIIDVALRTLLAAAPRFRAAQPLDAIEYSGELASHAIERLAIDTGVRP